jgi:uncharacterized membrane protein
MSVPFQLSTVRDDVIALGASALLLLGYELVRAVASRRHPTRYAPTLNVLVRSRWARGIAADPSASVLAVQTLRNSLMSASFMASTAVLLAAAVVGLLSNLDRLSGALAAIARPIPQAVSEIKILLLLAVFSAAFFLFSMSMRFYHHSGYLLTLRLEPGESELPDPRLLGERYLLRAGALYNRGLRVFYLFVPLAAWLFGPIPLAVATVLLVTGIAVTDKV